MAKNSARDIPKLSETGAIFGEHTIGEQLRQIMSVPTFSKIKNLTNQEIVLSCNGKKITIPIDRDFPNGYFVHQRYSEWGDMALQIGSGFVPIALGTMQDVQVKNVFVDRSTLYIVSATVFSMFPNVGNIAKLGQFNKEKGAFTILLCNVPAQNNDDDTYVGDDRIVVEDE